MIFKDPQQVSNIAWEMRCADWPRDDNRARINKLFNGSPPYSAEEVQQNNIQVNVNWLEGTRLSHDARMQMQQSMLKPGNFFTCTTDAGPVSKRTKWSSSVTKHINRIMKRSMPYYECFRSKIASTVLHGIAPSAWEDEEVWCPDPLGVEDLLIPARTLLTFKNLPFYCILRQLSAPELIKMTRRTERDKAWNMTMVDQCVEWIDRESMALLGNNYPDVWSPSKIQERVKGDGGYYMGDEVPTISVFDFYYWSDQNGEEGWRRRMVLDDWSTPASAGSPPIFGHNTKMAFGKNQWLYNSEDRVFGAKREQMFSCNFADLSAVSPFQYHSVRSLGFLLYAVCHLQNRLRCKFSESVFEALLMYFRVKSMDDAERVLKVELANRGFLDDSLNFIPANERYQVNTQLVELGLQENQRIINENASSFSQSQNRSNDRTEKTKFQVMAEVNAAQAMISAALMQSYQYQTFEYREIFRRFLRANSRDPDVLEARKCILHDRVPEKYLSLEYWNIEPERVLGGGNKTMEMAISEQLMQFRPLYDPEPQRKILRDVTLAITDDPARAEELVPEQPQVTDSVHDTELAFGALMQGSQVTPKSGLNRVEVVGRMLQLMQAKVQQVMQSGGVGTPQDLAGLQACAQYAGSFIELMSVDKEEKSTGRAMGQVLSKLLNEVRAMAQRQQEAAKQSAQAGNGQIVPKDKAKIQGMMMLSQVKAQNARTSHADRTAQKRISFQEQMKQKQQEHALTLRTKAAEAQLDLQRKAAETKLDISGEQIKQRMRSTKGE